MSSWWVVVRLLPELVQLLRAIDEAIKKSEDDRKIKDDVLLIKEAFKTNDPTKLNALFSNTK